MIEVATVERAALMAPLAPDPGAYLQAVAALTEEFMASLAKGEGDVEDFLAAHDAAYGRTSA